MNFYTFSQRTVQWFYCYFEIFRTVLSVHKLGTVCKPHMVADVLQGRPTVRPFLQTTQDQCFAVCKCRDEIVIKKKNIIHFKEIILLCNFCSFYVTGLNVTFLLFLAARQIRG